jgi:hypothetical protein
MMPSVSLNKAEQRFVTSFQKVLISKNSKYLCIKYVHTALMYKLM